MKRAFLFVLIAFAAIALVLVGVWLFRESPAEAPRPPASSEISSGSAASAVDASATVPSAAPQGQPTRPPAAGGPTIRPATGASTTVATAEPVDPFAVISQDSLFGFLEALTAIQPYSGWRNSASSGETEALDYVAAELARFDYLQEMGLDVERQEFRVFLGTELWETRLDLTINGRQIEVPADGLRGPRDEIGQALRFDSDGALNDSERDPVIVEGPVVVIRSAEEARSLDAAAIRGNVVFLDYSAVDRITQGSVRNAAAIAGELLAKEPAGLVLITRNSSLAGESHGTFVGDVSVLNDVEVAQIPPTLYARFEDLDLAGIEEWGDLQRIDSARLTWDADVFSPATSGNLAARIPGKDPSGAVILSAHIDSPNAPGAMDDGSGSAILLEVARVLSKTSTQPPLDLYLVWYGSEELGLYGSGHFVATHQELLDRTTALLQIDCLSRPLDGIDAELTLVGWSYDWLSTRVAGLPWSEHLIRAAGRLGVDVTANDIPYIYSDNSSFGGFDVPNADLIYVNEPAMEATGSLHYAAHIHDPYDTVPLAREVGDVLVQMAHVALAAALEPAPDMAAVAEKAPASLRVPDPPRHRALFLASHTEPVHMTPAGLVPLGMALSWERFDVDLVPYGTRVTARDLETADVVFALPVADYPSPEGDSSLYDEAWSPEEVGILDDYVAAGGLLVLTNSAHRLKHTNRQLDHNEDWEDANTLAAAFGIVFDAEPGSSFRGDDAGPTAQITGSGPLLEGITSLDLADGNSVPFYPTTPQGAQVLAEAGGQPVIALVPYGRGEVLVLGDLGILGMDGGGPDNLPFWRNLARYAQR